MISFKKFITPVGVLLVSMLGNSLPVSAQQVQDCLRFNRNDHLEDRHISYVHASVGSFSKCVGNGEFQPESANPYFSEVTSLLGRSIRLRNDLNSALTEELVDFGRDNVPSGLSYRNASGSVSGDITLTIEGQPDSRGVVRLSIDGFDVNGRVDYRALGIFNVIATANLRGVNISADYNVFNGQVTLNEPTFSSIRTDVDGSGFGSLLFFLEPFAEDLLDDLVLDRLERSIENSLSNSFTLFRLDEFIPVGEFFFDGDDLGLIVRDQVSNFVDDVFLSLELGDGDLNDTYVSITLQNITLTAGRRLFLGFGHNCSGRCQLP